MNVLVVGSVALDTVQTPDDHIERGLGGAAMYASVSASYFSQPGIVGVVGGDFPAEHIELMKDRGINLDGLQIDESGKTFFWAGSYEGDLSVAQTLTTELNVFETFNPTIPEAARETPFVLLGNIHPSLQLEVLDQARNPRMVLCDTMNFWIHCAPRELEKVFRRSTVVCINEDEARDFCNVNSLPRAAAELLKLGPERVIIKKGAGGVLLFGGETFYALPALPLTHVKDTTGAGDTFAGGFVGATSLSREIDEDAFRRGVLAGSVMASFCVEDFSCRRTANLTKAEILERMGRLREAVRTPELQW